MSKEQRSALVALELMLPRPTRGWDGVDQAARRQPCPVCRSRATMPCAWALPCVDYTRWSHDARRGLVDQAIVEQLAARAAELQAALDRCDRWPRPPWALEWERKLKAASR